MTTLTPNRLPPPLATLPLERPRQRALLDEVSLGLKILCEGGDALAALSLTRATVLDTVDSPAGDRVYDTAYLAADLKLIGKEHGLSLLGGAQEKEIGRKIQWSLRRRDNPQTGQFISRSAVLRALENPQQRALLESYRAGHVQVPVTAALEAEMEDDTVSE